MKVFMNALAATGLLITATATAHAAETISLAEILTRGYEVKATSTISAVDSAAAFAADTKPSALLLITLQRGNSVAVCQFNYGAWSTIGSTGMGQFNAKDRCDVVP
jgi:hypothetical protein